MSRFRLGSPEMPVADNNWLNVEESVGALEESVGAVETAVDTLESYFSTTFAGGANTQVKNLSATGYSGFSYTDEGGTTTCLFVGVDNANNYGRIHTTNSFPLVILTQGIERVRVLSAGGVQLSASDLIFATLGKGIKFTEGVNGRAGVATLAAGTVTVANTSVTATSRFLLTPQDNNTAGVVRVSARVAGTSFTITSSNAGDSGVIYWEIKEPA